MSFRLIFVIAFLPSAFSSTLNCTFNEQCCWFSHRGLTPWKVINTRLETINYRRMFRTEKFKGPPRGNFLLLTMIPNEAESAEWTSCPFCSRSGLVVIRLRAWQSPTAYIMLCWRFAEGTEVQSKICAHVNRLSQSEYSISRFAIPRERYVQFYIKMVNNGSRSKSSVVVDRILVETQLCTQSNATQKSKHLSVNRPPPPRAHASTPHVRPYRTSSPLPSSPERELKRVAQRASSSTSAATNPLNEIFGKEFAEFLREDLDTTNQDRAELMTSGVNKSPLMTSSVTRSKLVTSGITQQQFRNAIQQPERSRNPVIQLLSGESLGIESLACNTIGGCLFDHSMCSYRNSNFARKGIFRMVSVMNQRFVQAIVPPGGTAILEAETRFPEERVILFDLLEFTEGETLSVCCLKPQNFPREFICSYITQPRPTAVVWQTSRIVCPAGTTKLMFVCENYGRFDGSCSIDNIRLHKTNDILQLEPCQKNILRST